MFLKSFCKRTNFIHLAIAILIGCTHLTANSSELVPASYQKDYQYSVTYPQESRDAHEEGSVLLYGLIKATGEIAELKVKTSSGYIRLDDAALAAVSTWRFNPALDKGNPVDTWMEVPVKFLLSSDALPDHMPYQRNNAIPMYPAKSKKNGETGKVILQILVSDSGNVKSVEIKQSSGYQRLDDAALKAIRTWHFKPGMKEGKLAEMWTDVPVYFDLH